MCRNGQLPKELLCLSQLLLLLILSSLGGGLFLLLFGNSFSLLFLFSCLLLGLLPLQFDALSLLLLSQALLLLPLPFALATETRISGHRPLHQQGNPRDLLPLESLGLAIDLLGHPALLVTRIGHLHVVIGGLRRLKGEVSPRIEVSPVIVEGVNLVYWGRIVTKRGRGVVLILVAVSVVVASAAPLFLRLLLLTLGVRSSLSFRSFGLFHGPGGIVGSLRLGLGNGGLFRTFPFLLLFLLALLSSTSSRLAVLHVELG
mmetsp:Transcript_30030/g.66057  ORF Transcript_30030/g.66057 Transcript_30030/m.66057 type:complete len:259 (-) Transcript_30030:2451-3227(-)